MVNLERLSQERGELFKSDKTSLGRGLKSLTPQVELEIEHEALSGWEEVVEAQAPNEANAYLIECTGPSNPPDPTKLFVRYYRI